MADGSNLHKAIKSFQMAKTFEKGGLFGLYVHSLRESSQLFLNSSEEGHGCADIITAIQILGELTSEMVESVETELAEALCDSGQIGRNFAAEATNHDPLEGLQDSILEDHGSFCVPNVPHEISLLPKEGVLQRDAFASGLRFSSSEAALWFKRPVADLVSVSHSKNVRIFEEVDQVHSFRTDVGPRAYWRNDGCVWRYLDTSSTSIEGIQVIARRFRKFNNFLFQKVEYTHGKNHVYDHVSWEIPIVVVQYHIFDEASTN